MQISPVRGKETTAEGESVFVQIYNNSGAELLPGEPVCVDVANAATEGKGMYATRPATANLNALLGIIRDTIGTGGYSATCQVYGPVDARTYGVASTFVPGANLALTAAKSYVAYNSQAKTIGQRRCMTALTTNATVDVVTQRIMIQAM